MTLFLKNLLIRSRRKSRERNFGDLKQDVLNRVGREQFEKIIDKGLSLPIVML